MMHAPAVRKKNCISCANYFSCKDKLKSIVYVCNRHTTTKESLESSRAILEQALDLPIVTSNTRDLPITEASSSLLNDLDLSKMMDEIISSNRMVAPDVRIPEGDFATAPNFYTWCVAPHFLGQKPFVPQAMIGTKLFNEWCPDCSDPDFMQDEGGYKAKDTLKTFEQKVALLEYGVCPHCKKTRLHFLKKKKLKPYWELSLAAGQRSGKSAVAAMLVSYLTHRLIKLERPTEVLGLLSSTVLQCTFVALTAGQAKDTLWDPFYGNILDSPWFQEYHAMLDQHGGDDLYKLKDTFVVYKHRRLQIYPAGPDKRVLRGRTRFAALIDELSWFPNDADAANNVKMNADEVYIALERSLLTVRAAANARIKAGFDIPYGYFINISSPRSHRDKLMELIKLSQHSVRIYGLQRATWQMNPHVPKSALSDEFRKDPITAMRDYGAQPPMNSSPFFRNKDKVREAWGKPNPLKLETKYVKVNGGKDKELYASVAAIKTIERKSLLALDAGLTNNSFAFAVGHLSNNGRPIIALVGEVIPQPGIPLNYSLIYKHLLKTLVLDRSVVICAADRWNSEKILSDMEQDLAVEKRKYSLKYRDMVTFKSYVEDGQVLLPKPKQDDPDTIMAFDHGDYPNCFKHDPAAHLYVQCMTVQDSGAAVLKGDRLTDDILRAVMLCHHQLLDPQNSELLLGSESEEEIASEKPAMESIIRGRSMGGNGYGNAGSSSGATSVSIGRINSRS